MRLDVYQHNGGTGDAAAKTTAASTTAKGANAEERRKNRQADIQTFKNSRLVGEGHDGLLVVLEETAGSDGDYVRATVSAENSDRMSQMKAQAEKEKRSLVDIQKETATLWVNRSFKGEWIQTQGTDGSYRWVQKQG